MKRNELKDSVYLDIAKNISKLSKDENTKIGCIIVAADGTPVSWGYNGAISGWDDKSIPHSREIEHLSYQEKDKYVNFSDNKYNYMSHAEANALDFADREKLKGATVYLTQLPCKHCALRIAKFKIAKIIVATDWFEAASTVGDDAQVVNFILAQSNIELIINNVNMELNK